ncbi:MAG: cob(I)yrinic acid a,c-diamide adenosyltransferase [Candidatus Metalachnospira sp.]|nr:cob(I)yrinic acid a,c-diamide adenosyltransferase [Candidatus Metalachnospira sp.]
MERGLIHIYCGDGKGKTTAAVGLAVRCAGNGGKVLFTSFLKDDKSGELTVLRNVPGIDIIENPPEVKFFKSMTDDEKKWLKRVYSDRLEEFRNMQSGYDMVVLDEIIPAINNGLVSEEDIIYNINKLRGTIEYVLTGRNPSDKLLAMADYISEVKKIRHPFDKGIVARKMIEM